MADKHQILRIDGSARHNGSTSRTLTDEIIAQLGQQGEIHVTTRDLTDSLPHVSEAWMEANFTPADKRNDEFKARLAHSDSLVAEIQNTDTLVIGLPIYNFGVPAAVKAWMDMVARVGVTFKYTETGPKGLLEGKRAIIAAASGGTKAGSEIDFATPHFRHFLGFIGIKDVTLINATGLGADLDNTLAAARQHIADLKL